MCRCRISVSFYFIAVISFILIINPSPEVLLGIICALFHELGHVLMMIHKGRKINQVKIQMFNIDIIDKYRANESYRNDFLVLLSGSLINLVLFIFLRLVYMFTGNNLVNIFSYQNLALGIINLLPISSLDGGQMLFILLSRKLSLRLCEMVCRIISFVFLIPLAILGFIILIHSTYNFTLLILSCYLMMLIVFREDSFY